MVRCDYDVTRTFLKSAEFFCDIPIQATASSDNTESFESLGMSKAENAYPHPVKKYV